MKAHVPPGEIEYDERNPEDPRDGYECPVCGAWNDEYGPGCGCYEDLHYGD